MSFQCLAGALLCAGLAGPGAALATGLPTTVSVQDDAGHTITLAAPARRVVSLAPHTTELLFDAGAGDRVVATVRYGDYPAAAKQLPVVGDAHALDLEAIAALKPDLIVVWMHGNSANQIERLRALKLPIFYSEPKTLTQIGDSLRRLGTLAGTPQAGAAAATAYSAELARLRQRYGSRPPVRLFYQVWHQPLMTVNGQHLISDVIRSCGGVNVFADNPLLVPTLGVEAVLARHPQALATSTLDGQVDDSLALWRPFKAFEPVAKGALITIPSDHISRHTPRILLGAQRLCDGLEQVRAGQPVKLP
jgi:iron complex transport system substrate-binding protein